MSYEFIDDSQIPHIPHGRHRGEFSHALEALALMPAGQTLKFPVSPDMSNQQARGAFASAARKMSRRVSVSLHDGMAYVRFTS